jgi:hypothetical protein
VYEQIANFGLTEAVRNRPRRKAQSKISLLSGVKFTYDSETINVEHFDESMFESFKDFKSYCSELKKCYLHPEKIKLSVIKTDYSILDFAYNLGYLGEIVEYHLKDGKTILKRFESSKIDLIRDERLKLQKELKKTLKVVPIYQTISANEFQNGYLMAEKEFQSLTSDKAKFISDGSILSHKQITVKGCNPLSKAKTVVFRKFDLKNKTFKSSVRTNELGERVINPIEIDLFDSFFSTFDKVWNETKRKKNFDGWNTAKKQAEKKDTIIETVAKMLDDNSVSMVCKFIRSIHLGLISDKKQYRINYAFNEDLKKYELIASKRFKKKVLNKDSGQLETVLIPMPIAPQSKEYYSKKDANRIIKLATILKNRG